jgi:hypothetical protein
MPLNVGSDRLEGNRHAGLELAEVSPIVELWLIVDELAAWIGLFTKSARILRDSRADEAANQNDHNHVFS